MTDEAPTARLTDDTGPLGLDERTFDQVFRGYDRAQVDNELARMDAMLDKAEQHAAELEREVASLRMQKGGPSYEALGPRITQMLTLAEEEAKEIRQRAVEETAEATAKRNSLLSEGEEESRRVVVAAGERADAIVAEARSKAEQILADTQREVEFLERKRDAIRTELEQLHTRLLAAMGAASDADAAEAPTQVVARPAESE